MNGIVPEKNPPPEVEQLMIRLLLAADDDDPWLMHRALDDVFAEPSVAIGVVTSLVLTVRHHFETFDQDAWRDRMRRRLTALYAADEGHDHEHQ